MSDKVQEEETAAAAAVEGLVRVEFLKPDSDEVDFFVDLPESHYDLIEKQAEADGVSFSDKIIEIITMNLSDITP